MLQLVDITIRLVTIIKSGDKSINVSISENDEMPKLNMISPLEHPITSVNQKILQDYSLLASQKSINKQTKNSLDRMPIEVFTTLDLMCICTALNHNGCYLDYYTLSKRTEPQKYP